MKPIIITEKPVVIPGLPTFIPSECPKPSGTFRNKTRCSGYFTCIDNKVVVSSECAGGLLFNDVRKLPYLKNYLLKFGLKIILITLDRDKNNF